MKRFLKYSTAFFSLFVRGYLFVRARDPFIKFFKCAPAVGINDLPQFLKWHTRYSWKVEIQGIGRVGRKGFRILKNKSNHSSLMLIAYGRRNRKVLYMLELNHKRVELRNVSTFSDAGLQLQKNELGVKVGLVKKQIAVFQDSFRNSFNECQVNTDLLKALSIVTPPQRVNLAGDDLVSIFNISANSQQHYFSVHYDNEMQKTSQHKT